uniref:fructose-bisphosphate aldolase n=1 Tax=Dermatophagoides pteronyssinus TaxID=6956 RepID=A0A6P6XY02_DERPT|nr:fructose-bisphosphate aldolase 1-like [Dermatophagoides pteronyssinus]
MTIVANLNVPSGVVTGDHVRKIFNHAREHGYAIPAVNCTSSSTCVAVLEAAKAAGCPAMIQFSHGGAAFFAGKAQDNTANRASIAGAVAGALYVRSIAPSYGVPVILHSDHCAKKILSWLDGMLEADEQYFKAHGEPLFSSHMIDLSECSKEENIATSFKYLQRCAKINCLLEMEIGITGGEEDGVNNEGVDNAALYTQPEDIFDIFSKFSTVTDLFSIAAGFGNVHGVYKPGNVKLHPELLKKHQQFVKAKTGSKLDKPVYFVFHGGSGSTPAEIKEAVQNGVVKMNIDTDTQWAYCCGLRDYFESKKEYVKTQVGNPEGADKPNKKYYDPRVFIRKAEESMVARVMQAYRDLQALK